MSLLLCFFIMLFAMSIITPIKWEAFVETQNMKMGYTGSSKTPSNDNKPAASRSTTSEMSRRTAALLGGQPTAGRSGEYVPRQSMSITGETVKGGLVRFDLGSDVLTEQAKKDLAAMLPFLLTSSNKIMVKGHVAPTEDEGGIYSRDVYLAKERAIVVKDYLISLGLKKEFFQIGVADSTAMPDRAILPVEMRREPKLAGASVAVYLINETPRPRGEQSSDTPAP